jgi:high-affinity iron transporter
MNLPGFIVGFREGLESFLVLSLAFKYLKSLKETHLRNHLAFGSLAGVAASIAAGLGLNHLTSNLSRTAKIWESIFSLIAVFLITTLIFWMIRHAKDMKSYVHNKMDLSLTKWGVFAFASIIVMREGAEVVLFSFAGDYDVLSVSLGIFLALLLAVLIYFSLVKVKLKTLFTVTLVYLILQAGYLLGYSVHEGLSALKGGALLEDHSLYIKAFDLSSGILNHKDGWLGLPMNVILGWYSKPEWLPAILHYSYVAVFFTYWRSHLKSRSKRPERA